MPKTTNKLFSALAPWNAWDGPSPYTGISRDITPTLLPLIERPEALVLTGIRRGGKSTIMFQLVEALVAQGVKRQLMPDLSTRNNSAICCCVSQAVSTCTSGLWRAA
jgi:hypothetical protein